MARLDPALLPAVADLARGLRSLDVPFAIVGALVPELVLDAPPAAMTNDADVTVAVASLAAFATLKAQLATFGFAESGAPHRLRHRSGGLVDLLPFSDSVAPGGRLELERDLVMNMAGFEQAVTSAVQVAVDGGPVLPVVPLPLYVLLKLVSFDDRKAPKDLASVFHCLRYYLQDDERRYLAEHAGAGVPFEYAGAYWLGGDGRRFMSVPLARVVTRVLGRFAHADAEAVGIVARERGGYDVAEQERTDIFECFRWYRLGLDLPE